MTNNLLPLRSPSSSPAPVLECLPFRYGTSGCLHFLVRRKLSDGSDADQRLAVAAEGRGVYELLTENAFETWDVSKGPLSEFLDRQEWIELRGFALFPWEKAGEWLQYEGKPPLKGYYWHVLQPWIQANEAIWKEPVRGPVELWIDPRADRDDYHDECDNYCQYNGTYAQDVEGWSDDLINDVLDGCPDAIWNII